MWSVCLGCWGDWTVTVSISRIVSPFGLCKWIRTSPRRPCACVMYPSEHIPSGAVCLRCFAGFCFFSCIFGSDLDRLTTRTHRQDMSGGGRTGWMNVTWRRTGVCHTQEVWMTCTIQRPLVRAVFVRIYHVVHCVGE